MNNSAPGSSGPGNSGADSAPYTQPYSDHSYSSQSYATGEPRVPVAGLHIRPVYLYIAGFVAFLVAIYVVAGILNAGLLIHFGLVAGVLLLLANLRELLGSSYGSHHNTALLNCMIGLALLCAWLGRVLSVLFWLPGVALLALAVPLVLGRASVYRAYMTTARTALNSLRRVAGRAVSRGNF